MNIKILHLIEGAQAAKGLAVIIDVFRAFSLAHTDYVAREHSPKMTPPLDRGPSKFGAPAYVMRRGPSDGPGKKICQLN